MKQARFWIFNNGDVRLKLNAGQTVHHSFGSPTDEGYSWEAQSYSFDGETVTCEWARDARDCDGRHTASGTSHCRFDQLASGYSENGISFPAWQQGDCEQRDHTAEAMGY